MDYDNFGKVNSDLGVISDWLLSQNLSLNIGKVKCMLISRKKSRPVLPVYIDNQRIEQVSSFKLLGVTVTQDLSWSTHIGNVCSRAKKTIGLLYRLFGKAGPTTLSHLYKVMVSPLLDYSSAIWDPNHEVHRRSLERVQNFVARVTLNDWCTDPQCLRDKFDWPPLQKRRTFKRSA